MTSIVSAISSPGFAVSEVGGNDGDLVEVGKFERLGDVVDDDLLGDFGVLIEQEKPVVAFVAGAGGGGV